MKINMWKKETLTYNPQVRYVGGEASFTKKITAFLLVTNSDQKDNVLMKVSNPFTLSKKTFERKKLEIRQNHSLKMWKWHFPLCSLFVKQVSSVTDKSFSRTVKSKSSVPQLLEKRTGFNIIAVATLVGYRVSSVITSISVPAGLSQQQFCGRNQMNNWLTSQKHRLTPKTPRLERKTKINAT